jgi:hypothetical protein
VQAAVEAQDEATERLIGWVQLGVLGAFYWFAPKTFAPGSPIGSRS